MPESSPLDTRGHHFGCATLTQNCLKSCLQNAIFFRRAVSSVPFRKSADEVSVIPSIKLDSGELPSDVWRVDPTPGIDSAVCGQCCIVQTLERNETRHAL